eukprot:471951-Amphidinium_carterae.1
MAMTLPSPLSVLRVCTQGLRRVLDPSKSPEAPVPGAYVACWGTSTPQPRIGATLSRQPLLSGDRFATVLMGWELITLGGAPSL